MSVPEHGSFRWQWRRFWREMDDCAERYDGRRATGVEQAPSVMGKFRRGKFPLWKAFWIWSVFPLVMLGGVAYFAFQVWEPLSNVILLGFGVYGLITSEALRYTASRYEGAKVWRRTVQCLSFVMMIGCGLIAIVFSASAAG